jgi:hypothetical protein
MKKHYILIEITWYHAGIIHPCFNTVRSLPREGRANNLISTRQLTSAVHDLDYDRK